MTRRNNNVRRQYTAVHILCCVVFCVFIFLYLYFYQGDVMAFAQHILSGGATAYDTLVGASVITFVMLLVHVFVYSLLRLDRWFYWLTYVPSFLFLAIITDVTPHDGGVFNYMWLWLAPLLLVIYGVLVKLFTEVDSLGRDMASGSLFSKVTWVNILCTTLMMLLVVSVGNTDVTMHHRIKTEARIIEGDYDAALEVGSDYDITDPSLTMLRAYVLAMKGELPEHLFEYPLAGGSASLRPDGRNVRSLMIHNGDIARFIHTRNMGSNVVEHDYELCGELMDCRLDRFKEDLRRYYAEDSTLPKHYKEALLICDGISRGDTVGYAGKDMISRYADFNEILRKHNDREQVLKELKDDFSDTYWYYYALRRE